MKNDVCSVWGEEWVMRGLEEIPRRRFASILFVFLLYLLSVEIPAEYPTEKRKTKRYIMYYV